MAGGDTFNAGDVSAGHAVTALYEVVPRAWSGSLNLRMGS